MVIGNKFQMNLYTCFIAEMYDRVYQEKTVKHKNTLHQDKILWGM